MIGKFAHQEKLLTEVKTILHLKLASWDDTKNDKKMPHVLNCAGVGIYDDDIYI